MGQRNRSHGQFSLHPQNSSDYFPATISGRRRLPQPNIQTEDDADQPCQGAIMSFITSVSASCSSGP